MDPKTRPATTAELLAENANRTSAYTSWDHDIRTDVEIEDYPANGDDGRPLPLYTEEGFPLRRVRAFPSTIREPPALLANLADMHDLFERDIHANLGPEYRSAPMFAYPQAFTRYGNLQAHAPMGLFLDRVAAVNRSVCRPGVGPGPIECCGFQGYNYESHRTRTSASTHAAQTGPLTVMLSGTMRYPKPSTKWTNMIERAHSSNHFPFQELESKILQSDATIGAQFRKEVVYDIDMDSLKPEIRDDGG